MTTTQPVRTLNQKGGGLIAGLISFLFSIIIGLVAIRFVFRLIGANPDNSVVSWFYNASEPLVAPFFGIFGHTINIAAGRFEFDTLIALIVYGVIASILTGLFSWTGRRPHSI